MNILLETVIARIASLRDHQQTQERQAAVLVEDVKRELPNAKGGYAKALTGDVDGLQRIGLTTRAHLAYLQDWEEALKVTATRKNPNDPLRVELSHEELQMLHGFGPHALSTHRLPSLEESRASLADLKRSYELAESRGAPDPNDGRRQPVDLPKPS